MKSLLERAMEARENEQRASGSRESRKQPSSPQRASQPTSQRRTPRRQPLRWTSPINETEAERRERLIQAEEARLEAYRRFKFGQYDPNEIRK